MSPKLDHVTRQFLTEHATHALLWDALQGVVPHWSARLKRRWIRDFLPYWRADLMEQARQLRYLELAMRRGWFDEASGARRWVTFITLLDDHADALRPASIVNVFNLLAALPEVPEGLALGASQAAQIYGFDVLDATQLTELVMALMHNPAGDGPPMFEPTRDLYHVRRGRARTPAGEQWLAQSWGDLEPIALLEPFGTEPWHMVSELGLDEAGALIAYHRIENLSARLMPRGPRAFDFDGQTRQHEPTGLRRPGEAGTSVTDLIASTFDMGHGMRAGISRQGALAIFMREGER